MMDFFSSEILHQSKSRTTSEYVKDLCKDLDNSKKSPLYNTRTVIDILKGEKTNG